MKKVTLYTTKFCPYCIRAIKLLESKGIEYTNINANKEKEVFKAIKQQTGWDTVPQIFIEDQFIGGCDDMFQLESDGKLNAMLGL